MESIKRLTPFLSVAPQITLRPTSARCRRTGFRAVISNRPDGEGEGQPSRRRDRRGGQAQLGLEFRHIPVVSGQGHATRM